MTTGSVRLRGHPVAPVTGWPRRMSWAAVVWLAVSAVGCTLGEAPPPAPPAPPTAALEGPALAADGAEVSEARRSEASRVLADAERALDAGNHSLALELSLRVEEDLANVPGTSRALLVRARAYAGMGAWDEAEATAERYLSLFAPEDEGRAEAALLLAETRVDARHPGDVEALFGVPADAPSSVLERAEELAIRVAGDLDLAALREVVEQAPTHPRILPPFLTELAVRRTLMGEQTEGRALAERALELEPGEEVAERARRVSEGRIDELGGEVVVLGALLSEGGPPMLRQLSAEIRDGIEVALIEAEESGTVVRFELLDDEGSEARVAELVARLEAEGASGFIGPLADPAVAAAARARMGVTPVLSPMARVVPGDAGVFSLTGVDPSASRVLAEAALTVGVRDVVVMHPSTPEMEQEAQHFRRAFEDAGGLVRRTLAYPPGTTSFQEPFQEVIRQEPAGLVLLLSPEDVDLVAPQVAFFGVDDMEITILGNEAWASESVLQTVATRHTDGVVTVTSRGSEGEFGPRWDEFVERYEAHFQRTLRSPVAALGYDAARLLIFAASQGDGTPEGTARVLETIRDFPGATGVLEVVEGRIQRSFRPVRIDAGRAGPLLEP
jgi:ABC-type branched-subunit amino acid transport system substrate-binding protein